MWKAILPGEKVTQRDTIRHQPSASSLSFKKEVYQVVKTDLHYFEVVVKPGKEDSEEHSERKIIKYIDIGYHLRLEVWLDS